MVVVTLAVVAAEAPVIGVCGIGTMGIVHSLVIEVRERFWLNEVRTLSTWEAVRDTLTADGVLGE